MIALWSGGLALLVFLRSRNVTATAVTWSLVLLFLVGRAWNHQRAAKRRGVPEPDIWKHGSTRVIEVSLDAVAAVRSVREALDALPNADVKGSKNGTEFTADVGRRFGVAASRVQVRVTPDGENSRLDVSSKSHFAPGFDYGTNWEYVDLFERALDGSMAASPARS